MDDYIKRNAEISECGKYRYMLRRIWEPDGRLVHWIMLNPSTADASIDDPTIRRCMGFARAWGYGGIYVSNLFAYRTTDPSLLPLLNEECVGPDNDRWIGFAIRCPLIVCAWGAHPKAAVRARSVLDMLRSENAVPHCLGTTKDGHPRHPLYVKSSQVAQPYLALEEGAHPCQVSR